MKQRDYSKKMKLMEELHAYGYHTSVSANGFEVRRICRAIPSDTCGYLIKWKANYEYPNKDVTAGRVHEDYLAFHSTLSSISREMDISVLVAGRV